MKTVLKVLLNFLVLHMAHISRDANFNDYVIAIIAGWRYKFVQVLIRIIPCTAMTMFDVMNYQCSTQHNADRTKKNDSNYSLAAIAYITNTAIACQTKS